MSTNKSILVDNYMRDFERDLGPLSPAARTFISQQLLAIALGVDHIERKEAGLPPRRNCWR